MVKLCRIQTKELMTRTCFTQQKTKVVEILAIIVEDSAVKQFCSIVPERQCYPTKTGDLTTCPPTIQYKSSPPGGVGTKSAANIQITTIFCLNFQENLLRSIKALFFIQNEIFIIDFNHNLLPLRNAKMEGNINFKMAANRHFNGQGSSNGIV